MEKAVLDPALNKAPENVRHVHLMGVGGVAMGALAGGLKDLGLTVTGSDGPLYPPMSTFLEDKGIPVMEGFGPQNLEPAPDLVIVGNVIRAENPDALALRNLGLPYLSLPQALARFFIEGRTSIVAAGTHGKTTLTAMIASALSWAGEEPGYMVGGIVRRGMGNFARGEGRHFVVEGDEYDTAFFDKRPKFVHYRPDIAVLTSLEFDHADIYPDLDAVRRAFGMLLEALPPQGTLIAWGDSREVMDRVKDAPCRVVTYGYGEHCHWRLMSVHPGEGGGTRLLVLTPGELTLAVDSPLAGEHNALNTTACLAVLEAAGLDPEKASLAPAHFPGVRRRQEVRGVAGGVVVVDDFAHHPTAVRETIKAVSRFGLPGWQPGSGRLAAVFEPRTNTSKRTFFQDDYAGSFTGADLVFLSEPPGTADIPENERFSSERLAADLRQRGLAAVSHPGADALLDDLLSTLRPGDLCLVMSNGGFDNLHGRLLKGLEQAQSK